MSTQLLAERRTEGTEGTVATGAVADAPLRLVRQTRRRRLGRARSLPGGRLLGPLFILAVWEAAALLGLLDPRLLSGPETVAATGWRLIVDGTLAEHIGASLWRAVLGLVIGTVAGVSLAVVAGLTRLGESLVDGTVQVKRAIPVLALIPLLILWLGIGEEFKVTIVALGVLIPIYINTYSALTGIDRKQIELAESLGLSRWQYVRSVLIPGALPGFFVGFRLAVVGSWMALIVVETINATSGIGYMMAQAQLYAQSDIILVGLVVYGVFGFVSDALVRLLERKVLSWRRTLAS
ncbi:MULTISPECIES: ABC transporter permease [unclassified Microbacterium]|uniref:ABC transporter permease n=1 Tax=unclassified Microbacterium TaxID=2609290 RepID=UPI0012F71556|nr:ABC transporter permease [Microbacterium sp. MAH-37]MVQ43603.1 ABC transporter permease subunit [Microbacterium sp. MAH-37]